MKKTPALLTAVLFAVTLAACGSQDPLSGSSDPGSPSGQAIVIGSQQYYSNEIIAELYAQALEADGYQVDSSSSASTGAEVLAALADALPAGLRALDAAEATDQDSYTVTRATAEQYGLSSIGDLTKLPQPVTVGANSEFATRPYGIPGLLSTYGVQATLTPIEDSGSALTVKALVDGTVQVADIYTASPAIAANDLVSLHDPESLILPQNVVPVASDTVDEPAVAIINKVTAQLGMTDLIALNQRSVDEELPSSKIASDWLTEKGLI